MNLTSLLEALKTRGIGEAVLRGGESMQTRVNGEWKSQGAAIPIGALATMIEQDAPPAALAQWQSENRCQFEQDGFLIKAARQGDRVQVALKLLNVSTAPFSDASSQTTFAPTTAGTGAVATVAATASVMAKNPLRPAIVEWFYLDAGAEKGPVAPDRARILASTGTINGDTLVWCDGMSDWKPARDSDLRPLLPASALNPLPATPPLSPVAPIAAPRGDIRPGPIGGGRIHEIPPSHDKFSLGAFTLPLFWCSSHSLGSRFWPIFLTNFIPFVGNFISLYLSFQLASEANSLAWVSREWKSVEHFEKTQRVWSIVGGVMLVIYVLLFIVGVVSGIKDG